MRAAKRSDQAEHIRRLMNAEGDAVARNTRGFNAGRYRSVARLRDYEALKDRARAIKEDAIERLPELVEQLREGVEQRGGTFYLARDAADANRHIVELTRGARRLVKSKSMTSEEIRVNEHLERAGVEVVETDLGEWVVQLAGESPSHIVAPAIHKSRPAIAELFERRFHPAEPLETAEELTRFARRKLGKLIEGADVGMTGANFIAADTGTIVLVTSEGNARKSAVVPRTYIALAGVEKIIPTLEDVQPFVELIGRSATGQDLTSYVSLLTPPFETPVVDFSHPDGPLGDRDRAFHLVLIDNGRLAMRDDPQLRETLYCIRCGACANSCANFQSVGGHAFGGETYSGGIGTGWEAGLQGLDVAATFNELCTGCTRCVNACPVRIDIPWINIVVRDRVNRQGGDGLDWLADGLVPDEEAAGVSLQKRFFAHFATLARLGSATAPLSNWIARSRSARYLLERLLGIDRRRSLPAFRRETFRRWFARRTSHVDDPVADVVLYPDVYTNHVLVDRGRAAVRVLEAFGVRVHLPNVLESGRAAQSQGMIATAQERARAVYEMLTSHLDAGRDVVVIEPSDLAMFRRDYARYLPEASFERLRDRSFEVMEYVARRLQEDGVPDALRRGDGQPVAYHSHCQQRTLGLEKPTVDVLRLLGYDVMTSQVECCGMAGSFGYKEDFYELSMNVGAQLRDQFTAAEAQDRVVIASGTSCQEQLEALLGTPSRHPVELL